MNFEGFSLHALPIITDAYCKCGAKLHEVSNGFFSRALFCAKCENVYVLKKIKVPQSKITPEFLKQARDDVERKSK